MYVNSTQPSAGNGAGSKENAVEATRNSLGNQSCDFPELDALAHTCPSGEGEGPRRRPGEEAFPSSVPPAPQLGALLGTDWLTDSRLPRSKSQMWTDRLWAPLPLQCPPTILTLQHTFNAPFLLLLLNTLYYYYINFYFISEYS